MRLACLVCGSSFYARPSDVAKGKRFCSKVCKGHGMRGRAPANRRHGLAGSPTWKSWDAMRQRCLNPKCKDYPNYGGRGINLDPRWAASFDAFLADMGERPLGLSLGRIDNEGCYCKANCRWETDAQQNNNRRSSRFIEHAGQRLTVAQWAAKAGLSRQTLRYRIEAGWPIHKAIESGISRNHRSHPCL